MRLIKFRAKTFDTGVWVYGSLLERDIDTGEIYIRVMNPSNLPPRYADHKVINETVSQFTGILDKSGKEVYNGDVLRGFNYPFVSDGQENYVGIIDWVFNSWQLVLRKSSDRVRGISDGINHHIETEKLDMEVIGNIFDNPEYQWETSNSP